MPKEESKKIIGKMVSATLILTLFTAFANSVQARILFTNDIFFNDAEIYEIGRDDSTVNTDLRLQFGGILGESLEWDSNVQAFLLSDELIVDGNIDQNGTVFTFDADNSLALGSDIDIIANQGIELDGTIRYSTADNQWEISNNGEPFFGIHQAEVFYAYDNTGAQSMNNEVVVDINTPVVTDGNYSLNGIGEVTITEGGLYKITAKVATEDTNTAGGARVTNEIRIQNGAVDIPGVVTYCYHRETMSNTCEVEIIEALNDAAVIRITAERIEGSTNIETRTDGSSLMIERIR